MKSVAIQIGEKNQQSLRDTTVGKVYNAVRFDVGDVEPQSGCTAEGTTYAFFDDVGDYAVKMHNTAGAVYEVQQ